MNPYALIDDSRNKLATILPPTLPLNIVLPSTKEYNYEIHTGQTNSILIKFIVNNINIYVS